ncbi:hypothetical protein CUU45_00060 [Pectobacterium polaris]|uniref:hypothetical protein n=1 Tax=Pectobacterium polaris TaxID=2042057 RepID=UPI0015837732|nr:hypothetical protein [Pectobacterium polaris]MCU1795687.1 hypothetical protein [Pectobacterium polaris]
MSENPFDKIINESLGNINKLSQIKSEFSRILALASESLNNALQGQHKLDLRIKLGNENLASGMSAIIFTLQFNHDDSKGFIFLTNELKAEVTGSWEIDEKSETISITYNKIKNTSLTTQEGITEAVSFVISQKSFLETAIKLKKNLF